MQNNNEELFDFPCLFPIKVMGESHADFSASILSLVKQYAPDTNEKNIQVKQSSGARYISLTITINAESREQLDNLYSALSKHSMVKVVL